MKGILLLSIGSKTYGQFAYSLAHSIKKYNKNLQIALVTDDHNQLPFKDVIDIILPVSMGMFLENGKMNPFKLKTYIYDLSPFDETLYLDVDALCLKPLDDLFIQLNKTDFQIYEVRRYKPGSYDTTNMVWYKNVGGKLSEAIKLYNAKGTYPEYNSSFIWFKKSPANEKYFNQVKSNYLDRRVKFKKIGMFYPDELAFNMASAQLSHYGLFERFRPIYFKWDSAEKNVPMGNIREKYWFLGMAGVPGSQMVTMYDRENKTNGLGYKFNALHKIIRQKG